MAPNNPIVRVGIAVISEYLSSKLEKIKRRRNRRWWIRPWVNRRNIMGASTCLLEEWIAEDQAMFKNHLRMSTVQFEQLLEKVTPLIRKQNTNMRESLPPRLKLQIVLRYVASGDCFATLEALYRIPKCSISRFLPEVLAAIYKVLEEYIKVSIVTYIH